MVRTAALVLTLALLVVVAMGNGSPAYAQLEESQPQLSCDPFLSGIASFVIPGWGQWLNGEQRKAVTHIAVGLGLNGASILLTPTLLGYLAWVARGLWGFYSTYDAFTVCVRRHDVEVMGALR
ncbi:MAG: hypothetical protein ABEK03_06845 [Candidatus Bipolaricaulia bacterium]